MQKLDLIIVGAGPAGLSAALQAARRGLNCLVLEASDAIAGTIRGFTGGKWIMAEPSHLQKRSPLPFNAASREALLSQWEQVARKQQLQLRCNEAVVNIEGEHPHYVITSNQGNHYQCRHIILAYGVQGQPTPLPAAGAKMVDVHYRVPVGGWRDQRIVVVGAGDSALEDALLLAEHNNVLLLNRKDHFARAKPANRQQFEAAVAERRIQYLANSQILALEPRGQSIRLLVSQQGNKRRLRADQLLVRIGTQSPRRQLEQWGLFFNHERDPFPALDEYHQTNRKGIYVIGALAGEALIKPGINQGYNAVEHLAGKPATPLALQTLNQRLKQLGSRESAAELVRWLSQHFLFRHLSRQQLLTLIERVQIEKYPSGHTLLNKGDYSEALYLLRRGHAEVTLPEPVYLDAGDCFGEFSLLSRQPVSTRVRTTSNSKILVFPRAALESLWRTDARFWRQTALMYFQRFLTSRLQYPLPNRLLKLLLLSAQMKQLGRGDTIQLNNQVAFIINGQVSTQNGEQKTHLHAGKLVGGKSSCRFQAESARTDLMLLPYNALAQVLAPDTDLNALLELQGQTINRPMVKFFDHQQITNANNLLVIDKDKCVGCDNCETACAATHEGQSRVNRSQGETLANTHLPGSCRHCQQAYCMQDCPADAIYRAADGSVQINQQCIGCGNCARLCPFDAIKISSSDKSRWLDKLNLFTEAKTTPAIASKCDLCAQRDEGPACVQACPTGAAQRVTPQQLINLVNLQ